MGVPGLAEICLIELIHWESVVPFATSLLRKDGLGNMAKFGVEPSTRFANAVARALRLELSVTFQADPLGDVACV